MLSIPTPKTSEQLRELGIAFAEGKFFCGLHISLDKSISEQERLVGLYHCWPTLQQPGWAFCAEHELLPYSFIRDALFQTSKSPPRYIWNKFELLHIAQAIEVLRIGSTIFQAMEAAQPD